MMGQVKPLDAIAADEFGIRDSKPQISEVRKCVGRYFAVSRQDMLGPCKAQKMSHPRQIAMALAYELTGASLPAVGRHFNRDHSTVLHAIKCVARRAERDEVYRERLAMLRRVIGKSSALNFGAVQVGIRGAD